MTNSPVKAEQMKNAFEHDAAMAYMAEHLENEDYSDIDRENDESIQRHDD